MSKARGIPRGVQSTNTLFSATRRAARLADAALAIRGEGARPAGELAFNTRLLAQTTLPHTDPGMGVREYERANGDAVLYIQAGPRLGLPFGVYPRLILSWITSEATRLNSRHLTLGDSLGVFMGELGLLTTGGQNGTIPRFRDQMQRLLAARIVSVWDRPGAEQRVNTTIADRSCVWWDPTNPAAPNWRSELTLSEPFFEEVCEHAFPLDMRVLRVIKRSPLAVDLYSWLAWRVPRLKASQSLPWREVEKQFGAGYGATGKFTYEAKRWLNVIRVAWPQLRYDTPRGRLILHPAAPHVAPRSARTFLFQDENVAA